MKIVYSLYVYMYLYINVYVEKIKNNDLYFVVLEYNDNCINIVLCDFFK